ncbi:hypothetical protein V6N13_047085 [Hibiscus sabdariffa]
MGCQQGLVCALKLTIVDGADGICVTSALRNNPRQGDARLLTTVEGLNSHTNEVPIADQHDIGGLTGDENLNGATSIPGEIDELTSIAGGLAMPDVVADTMAPRELEVYQENDIIFNS